MVFGYYWLLVLLVRYSLTYIIHIAYFIHDFICTYKPVRSTKYWKREKNSEERKE